MEQLSDSPLRFAPARLKARHDGWTAERQVHFIAALDATRSVTRACTVVGMSPKSAYSLRARPEAASFAQAWGAALAFDPLVPRQRSPLALLRLIRMTARGSERPVLSPSKGDNPHETHNPPDSSIPPPLARLLRHLRNTEKPA